MHPQDMPLQDTSLPHMHQVQGRHPDGVGVQLVIIFSGSSSQDSSCEGGEGRGRGGGGEERRVEDQTTDST